MAKRENLNIGHVVCGFHGCTAFAAVRRDKHGDFYQECMEHGVIRSSQNAASLAIADKAIIWSEGKAPAGIPRWIAENWSTIMRQYRRPACLEAYQPDKAAPLKETAPADPPAPAAPPPPRETTRTTAAPPPPEESKTDDGIWKDW